MKIVLPSETPREYELQAVISPPCLFPLKAQCLSPLEFPALILTCLLFLAVLAQMLFHLTPVNYLIFVYPVLLVVNPSSSQGSQSFPCDTTSSNPSISALPACLVPMLFFLLVNWLILDYVLPTVAT